MNKTTAKPRAKRSLIASTIAAVGIFGSLMAVQASAATKPASQYTDTIEGNGTTQLKYEFGKHTYFGKGIWATETEITADSRVDYLLQLFFDVGTTKTQIYPNVICDTDVLEGSFWWDNVIKDNRAVAHLGFERIDNSHTLMYGNLYSAGTYEVK